jgi:hypothetical protein
VRTPTTRKGKALDVLLSLGGDAYFSHDLRRSLRRMDGRSRAGF